MNDPTDFRLPPLDLLRVGREAAGNHRHLDQMTRQVERTLHQFGVDARVALVTRGPTVTRFEVELGEGIRFRRARTTLAWHQDDLAYGLGTAEIRIVAPIPGKSAIGIEIPNRDRDLVALGDVLRAEEGKVQTHPLTVGLGRDIAGNPVLVNLAQMPQLLMGGTTGSGKSVTMNGIVTSVLMRTTPNDVRMLLIDPKGVELNHYEEAPHLLRPVVTDPKEAVVWLQWTVQEMERRYAVLAGTGHRNLDTYTAIAQGKASPLPYVLVVIDELADVMMVAPRDVETHIAEIGRKGQVAGVHLLVSTNTISPTTVSSVLREAFPSRICFRVSERQHSHLILGQDGAERLLGLGDMFFLPARAATLHRVQGCYADEQDIQRVMAWWRQWPRSPYDNDVPSGWGLGAMVHREEASDQDLVREAMRLVVTSGLGSTSMLQRKLKIGFAQAGRLMDELQAQGVVAPSEGAAARRVLMTVEELARLED